MMIPVIVAHGALGSWDEVIYISIAAIFVGFMVVSWFRSRNQVADDDNDTVESPEPGQSGDRFKLQ